MDVCRGLRLRSRIGTCIHSVRQPPNPSCARNVNVIDVFVVHGPPQTCLRDTLLLLLPRYINLTCKLCHQKHPICDLGHLRAHFHCQAYSIMAPAAATQPMYGKDEKVLCFHHELLYEAKVLEAKLKEPNDPKDGYMYRVHYKGWKNT